MRGQGYSFASDSVASRLPLQLLEMGCDPAAAIDVSVCCLQFSTANTGAGISRGGIRLQAPRTPPPPIL